VPHRGTAGPPGPHRDPGERSPRLAGLGRHRYAAETGARVEGFPLDPLRTFRIPHVRSALLPPPGPLPGHGLRAAPMAAFGLRRAAVPPLGARRRGAAIWRGNPVESTTGGADAIFETGETLRAFSSTSSMV